MLAFLKSLVAKYLFKAELAKMEEVLNNVLLKAEAVALAEVSVAKAELKLEAAKGKAILANLKAEAKEELVKAEVFVQKLEAEAKAELAKIEAAIKSL